LLDLLLDLKESFLSFFCLELCSYASLSSC
jgi:hypothetical protein